MDITVKSDKWTWTLVVQRKKVIKSSFSRYLQAENLHLLKSTWV